MNMMSSMPQPATGAAMRGFIGYAASGGRTVLSEDRLRGQGRPRAGRAMPGSADMDVAASIFSFTMMPVLQSVKMAGAADVIMDTMSGIDEIETSRRMTARGADNSGPERNASLNAGTPKGAGPKWFEPPDATDGPGR